jgi:hypothetical protein
MANKQIATEVCSGVCFFPRFSSDTLPVVVKVSSLKYCEFLQEMRICKALSSIQDHGIIELQLFAADTHINK